MVTKSILNRIFWLHKIFITNPTRRPWASGIEHLDLEYPQKNPLQNLSKNVIIYDLVYV